MSYTRKEQDRERKDPKGVVSSSPISMESKTIDQEIRSFYHLKDNLKIDTTRYIRREFDFRYVSLWVGYGQERTVKVEGSFPTKKESKKS